MERSLFVWPKVEGKKVVFIRGCCTEAKASNKPLPVLNNGLRQEQDLSFSHTNIQFGYYPKPPPHSSNQELITVFKIYYTRGTFPSILDAGEKDTDVRVSDCWKP
jgi:hypothetical protein